MDNSDPEDEEIDDVSHTEEVDEEDPYLKQSYYLKLHRFISVLGTLVLRKRFDKSFPPTTLVQELKKNNIKIRKIEPIRASKILSQKQYLKLYPKGKNTPNSEQFDLSLLVILLRHICGLNAKDKCWDPNGKIKDSDVSVEANIARLRNIRNDIVHDTNPALEEEVFKDHWTKVSKILLQLAADIPELEDLTDRIDELRRRNLDVLSPELRSLKSNTPLFFDEYNVGDEFYVETESYQKAKQILEANKVLILTGLPGEGKSTMAARLALDLSKMDKCLHLREPRDWTSVDLKLKIFDTIIIDDIFGARAFDRTLVKDWRSYLLDMKRAVGNKKVKVIITTREYIMEEAKPILGSSSLFENENIFYLSSTNLSDFEKTEILSNLSSKHDRNMVGHLIHECATQSSSYFIRSDNTKSEFQFGFPECANMFVKSNDLYKRGSEFFEKPNAFFKTCLQDLYGAEENGVKFLALVAVWANDGRLSMVDLGFKRIPENIKNIAESFGFDFKLDVIRTMRKSLEYHKGGFLAFNDKLGEYRFSHNVIADMVGLVVSEDHPEATVEFCSRDFMMEYVTIDDSTDAKYKVVLKEYQYELLREKIVKLILRKDCNTSENKADYNFSGLKRSGVCSNKIEPRYDLDIGILNHPIFKHETFVGIFLDCVNVDNDTMAIFETPVMTMSGFFYNYGIKMESLDMCLAAYCVFTNVDTLVKGIFERQVLKEDSSDRCMSLMLATHSENIQMVQFLLRHRAKVTGDTIYIAIHKKNIALLSELLQHPATNVNDRGNAVKGNYPLIVAVRKGYTEAVQCLIDNKVDLSVQNTAKMTALHKAIVYKEQTIIKKLIENGAPLGIKGGKFKRTPLHVASDMGDQLTVEHILRFEKGQSFRVKDHRGHFAIHCAAIRGYTEIVRLLMQHDKAQAKLKVTSYGKKSILKGMTVYHVAVWKKNMTLIDVLIALEADPNTVDCFGRTPLFCAIESGEINIATKLLPLTDLQKPQKQGYTPLHAAIHRSETELALLICARVRVDVNAKDKYGKTPLHVACGKGNFDIVRELTRKYLVDIRMLTKRNDSVFHILQRNIHSKKLPKTIRSNCVQIAKYLLEIDPSVRDWLKSARNKKGIIVTEESLLTSSTRANIQIKLSSILHGLQSESESSEIDDAMEDLSGMNDSDDDDDDYDDDEDLIGMNDYDDDDDDYDDGGFDPSDSSDDDY